MQTWFPGGTTLTRPDFSILAFFIAALLAIACWFGRQEQTLDGFFLARRKIPGWAASLSFLASEVSAMTIIGVPAMAYSENWKYLQFYIGAAVARVVIAYWFVPVFHERGCASIYEYLRGRFGPSTEYAASTLFFATRLLNSGVRLMAASVAVAVFLGWHLGPSIALFSLVSIAYIGFGGMEAVVWGGVLQVLVFTGAGIATLTFLAREIQGGIPAAFALVRDSGRLSVFDFPPILIGAALFNGFFGSLAAFGTDQDQMQPLLTTADASESRRAMLWTIPGSFLVILLYLAIGTGIYVFYTQHPEMPLPRELDKIYPHFTVQAIPALLRGLVLASIFLASVDSPLISLATTFVNDFYRPLVHPDAEESHCVLVSRISIIVFGAFLAAIAYLFSLHDDMLWLGFKIGGVTLGPLLGIFLLGLLTRRTCDRANAIAVAAMAFVNLGLLILSEKGALPLGWSWLVALGAAGTFAIAWLYGPALEERPDEA